MTYSIQNFSNESEVAARFEQDWGDGIYPMREGRLPSFYTNGMKYIGAIDSQGKIAGVTGYIDKDSYFILGGTFTHPDYQRGGKKHAKEGSPFSKLKNYREGITEGKPKMAGFKRSSGTDKEKKEWISGYKKIFNLEEHEDIPQDMIDNFKQRYGDAWGIRKNFYYYVDDGWFDIIRLG